MPKKVNIIYKFPKDYNPIYVNGAYGGATPKKEIIINFFLERMPIPKEENIEVNDFSMVELAEQGYSYIPVSNLCEHDRDNIIKGKVLDFFTVESDDNDTCANFSGEDYCEYFGCECIGTIKCDSYVKERKNRCRNKGRGGWCAKLQELCRSECERDCDEYGEVDD
jgi:hypothetical protein